MGKDCFLVVVSPRRISVVTGLLVFVLLSGFAAALPLASAQSAVTVTIPVGAGAGASAAPGYSPDNVTVVIGVNNTVTWINDDTSNGGTDHTVTSTSVPSGASAFDSGIMKEGANFTQTLTVPGTYRYHCTIHSWMTGAVVVLASTKTTPEFPPAYLAATLLVVIAAVIVAVNRLRPTISAGSSSRTTEGQPVKT